MERHIIPDSENRMILLETLSSIGPLSDTQLLVFVTDLSLMNYFSLHLNLSELEQQGLIEQFRHPFAMLYRITDSGRYMLESFPNIIPQSRRKLLSANVTAYRDRFRSQQLMPCSESHLPDGTTCIRLQLLEKDLLVLDMRLKTSEHLSCLEKRWQTIASEIYSLISDTLTEGFHRNRTGPVPETVSLTKSVRGEWKVGIKDPAGSGMCETVGLGEGESLATSATYFRGRHIYDARTGSPVSNGVASVTVRCRSAMMADGLSTTLFVLGVDAGREFISRFAPDASALFVLSDGSKVWK